MLSILIILNVILAVITVIFAIKNLLIKFNMSKSKVKNIVVIFFVLSILILSSTAALGSVTIDNHINQLQNDLSKVVSTTTVVGAGSVEIDQTKEIQMQLDLVKNYKIQILIYTIVGYLFFACLWILHKNIIKEINETKKTGSWDLSKYK